MNRITISLEKEIEEKVKELQETLAKYSGKGVSTSKIINSLVIAGLLSTNRLHVVEWSKIRDFFDGKQPDLKGLVLERVCIKHNCIKAVVLIPLFFLPSKMDCSSLY